MECGLWYESRYRWEELSFFGYLETEVYQFSANPGSRHLSNLLKNRLDAYHCKHSQLPWH